MTITKLRIGRARDLAKVSASSGNTTSTLPLAQPMGTKRTIKKTDASVNTVTIAAQGSDVLDSTTGSLVLRYQNEARTVEVTSVDGSGNATWTVVGDHTPLTGLDTRYPLTSVVARSTAYGPAPSGDTTGATDTAALTGALAALGSSNGIVRPTSGPLNLVLGPGPYYITPEQLTVKAGQTLRSAAPSGTLIYAVGGTPGQVFVKTMDPTFTLNGTGLTSQGGGLEGVILDGIFAGPGTVGVQRGDILNSRLDLTVQNFGGTNLAFQAATGTISVGGRSDTATTVASSPVVSDTSVVAADFGAAVTGASNTIPPNAYVGGFIVGQSLLLTFGSRPAAAGALGSGAGQVVQVGWKRNTTVTLTSGNNFVPDTGAVATDLWQTVWGTNIPLNAIVVGVNPGVGFYIGTAATGLLYRNLNGWFEKNHNEHVQTFNNHMHIVFDGSVGYSSFDYNEFNFYLNPRWGQQAITMRKGANLLGVRMHVQGNFQTQSTNNSGAALVQQGASFFYGEMQWFTETGGLTGAQPSVSHFIVDSNTTFYGGGSLFFINTTGFTWQTSKIGITSLNAGNAAIGFRGAVGNVYNIVSGTGYGAGSGRVTGITFMSPGFLSVSGSTITIGWPTGNIYKATLAASTAYTIAFDSSMPSAVGQNQAVHLTLILVQPASGSVATVSSWFTGITWTGTASASTPPALSSTNGGQTMVELYSVDGGTTWTGRASISS